MTSENGRGTLTIQDVKEADQGAYTCEAINAKGLVFGIPDGVLALTSNPNPGTDAVSLNRTSLSLSESRNLNLSSPPRPRSRQLPRGPLQCGGPLCVLLLCWNHQELQENRSLSQPD